MLLARRLVPPIGAIFLLVSCGNDDGDGSDEALAGQLGEPCLGGTFCNEGLVCEAGVCVSADEDDDDEAEATDGDATDGDSTADDDSTTTTGGDSFPLYEGPCSASEECENGGWCVESYFFCSMPCMEDVDCPAHPSSTATPRCTGLFSEVGIGGNAMLGCALECEDGTQCHGETQCWAVGTSTWCGY
jgi:hypothetical protein